MFSQFALHERLLKAVAELNFTEPTPVQQAAIPPALEGRDLRVTAQTGSGKTAAFLLPLLNRLLGDANSKQRTDVRSLILLPTRELALQTFKRDKEADSKNALVILSDGEDTVNITYKTAEAARQHQLIIVTAGIGTTIGTTIPDEQSPSGLYRDRRGQHVVSSSIRKACNTWPGKRKANMSNSPTERR